MEENTNNLMEEVKAYSQNDWYNLFVNMFLSGTGREIDEIHRRVRTAVDDAFAIISVKKTYEDGELHKRLW